MSRSGGIFLKYFMKLSLAVLACFYEVYASTCSAKENVTHKNLIQTQSFTQRQDRGGHDVLRFDEDALPPWAFPREDNIREAALEAAQDVLEARRRGTSHTHEALLQRGPGREGDVPLDEEVEEDDVPSWRRRLRHARRAAERAHQAVREAHRRLFHTARASRPQISMVAHKGGPQVITMVYVMTVPVGILSIGFGFLMIVRFADSMGAPGEEDLDEEPSPSPEEVLQGEPWNPVSSDGDGSLPPVGRLRIPHNSLPQVDLPLPAEKKSKGMKKAQSYPDVEAMKGMRKSRSEPDLKELQVGKSKLDHLHGDLQQALSGSKKGSVNISTPAHLNFRPFPEQVPPWALRKKGAGSSNSNSTSTTVSEDERCRKERDRKAHLQDPAELKMRRLKERDASTQSLEPKGHKARSDRRKGHRSRPHADDSSQADEDGLSADSAETLSPCVTAMDRKSWCRNALRLTGPKGLPVAQERAMR